MTRQILIVEDEQLLLRTLTRALSHGSSYEVSGVDGLAKARDALERLRPDLVICDLALTDGTGLEVLDLLRRHGLSIPVIVLSAMVDEFADRLPDSPRVIVRRKPFPAKDLLALVESQLSLSGSSSGSAVFSVADYLQMAHFSQRSIRIDLRYPSGTAGIFKVWKGEPWSARIGNRRGMAAVAEILNRTPSIIATAPLSAPPTSSRELEIPMQGLLLDLARQHDEGSLEIYVGDPGEDEDGSAPDYAARFLDALCRGAMVEAAENLTRARLSAPTDPRLQAWWCELFETRYRHQQIQNGGAA